MVDTVALKITLEKTTYDYYKELADSKSIPLATFLRSVLVEVQNKQLANV